MKVTTAPLFFLAAGVVVGGLLAPQAAWAAGDAAKGKEVFEQCSACHNYDSPEKKVGPSLQGLYSHQTLVNGKPVTDENVLAFVNTGGNGMPGYADILEPPQKEDLMAFLKTLGGGGSATPAGGAGAGDIAKGKEAFEQCAVCHNVDSDEKKVGPGLKSLFSRANLVNGKPVTDETVLEFINKGGNGMPGYEDMLESPEKKDIVAYLKSVSGGATPNVASASGGDIAKGKEAFEQCAVCHNIDSDEKKVGPGLKSLFSRATLVNGKPVTDETVLEFINKGGNGMPGYEDMLESPEKKDIVAYLKSVSGGASAAPAQTPQAGAAADPALVAQGKELFEQCSVCHNADSAEKKVGPGLKGLFGKQTLSNGKPATEENIRQIINEGGNGMPAYKDILEQADRDAIIAYMKSL